MAVPVLLFASYADSFGTRELLVPVDAPCAVETLLATLRTLPGGARLPNRVVVAVNHRIAAAGATVQAGDEVALIPPVAGG